MPKQLLTSLIIVVLIVVAAVVLARPSPQGNSAGNPTDSPQALTIDHTSYDFGTVSMAQGNVTHAFKVKNESTGEIKLNKLYTSCMCTTATLSLGDPKNMMRKGPFGMPGHGFIPSLNAVLAPHEEATVEVTFDPNAHGPAGVGRIERVISLESSLAKPLEFNISAVVTP
ncbi:MAG: DUF1573 domain-containing protein [Parcubacteria group bacterium]|nr:DUF1573 domain-containing protein [Parcubacteria group bacterium]